MSARKSMVAARRPRRTPRRRSAMDRRRQSRPRLGRRPQPRMLRPLRRSTAPRLHPRALRPPRRRAPRLLPRLLPRTLRPPRRRRGSRIARRKTASRFAGKAMRKRAAPDGSACFRIGAAAASRRSGSTNGWLELQGLSAPDRGAHEIEALLRGRHVERRQSKIRLKKRIGARRQQQRDGLGAPDDAANIKGVAALTFTC